MTQWVMYRIEMQIVMLRGADFAEEYAWSLRVVAELMFLGELRSATTPSDFLENFCDPSLLCV